MRGNRWLDGAEGFDGKLNSSTWAVNRKCSPGTALRDITGLPTIGVLRKSVAGGRSIRCELTDRPRLLNSATRSC